MVTSNKKRGPPWDLNIRSMVTIKVMNLAQSNIAYLTFVEISTNNGLPKEHSVRDLKIKQYIFDDDEKLL